MAWLSLIVIIATLSNMLRNNTSMAKNMDKENTTKYKYSNLKWKYSDKIMHMGETSLRLMQVSKKSDMVFFPLCRNKFVEFDMKPVCKKCYEKFPLELKKRLKKLAESLGRKWVAFSQRVRKYYCCVCDGTISRRTAALT